MPTLPHSMESLFAEEWTCSLEGSLASRFPSQGNNEARAMTVSSGLQCFMLYPIAGPLGLLARTLMGSLTWSSTVRLLAWKVSATQSGRLRYQLAPLMRGTSGTAFGLLPTMTVLDVAKTRPWASSQHREGSMHSMTLMDVMLLPTLTAWESARSGSAQTQTYYRTESGTVRHRNKAGNSSFIGLIPTISASEGKGAARKPFAGSPEYRSSKTSEGLRECESDHLYLNPSFAEVFMGYPSGWTDLEHSETP